MRSHQLVKPINILLVEDNPGDADLIEELLPTDGPVVFDVDSVARLAEALASVGTGRRFDIVLLDLGLPDSDGLETLSAMRRQAAALPIVVLTGNNDEQMGLAAIRGGAQDYLIKGQINRNLLTRSINYAVERKRGENALKELNDTLEERIAERTALLTAINETLRIEIAQHKQTEEQLRKNKEHLRLAHAQLETVNNELEQRVERRTEELQKSHEQLLHAEKLSAVGQLSASIAHEFNNPLQSVMTIIKGIGQYVPLGEKEEKLVALALQECHRMKSLISNLRDFYRPTSGKLAPTDLHATLDTLLLIGKKDLHTRDITVVKKYGNLPAIMAVPDQVKQVFLNLLTNAADACEGGGTITIATDTTQENVVVRIEDNGTGINPAHIAHIFEPFFTTKSELKGTGLGLSVSYGIIKKHGGHIDVKSEPGKGSMFSVFLPVMSAHNES